MLHPIARRFVVLLLIVALGGAQAFQWTPFEFPAGDQGYTMEVVTEEGTSRIDIDIVDRGGSYDVTTTMTLDQVGIGQDDLSDAMFGGAGLAMFGFGPMMLFGPSFFLLPMLLGEEDIAVQATPMRVMGMGTMYMDREEVVAGQTCVVIRMELEGGDELEFAVAEGVPLPCFSRYGSGSDAIEVRLIDVR
ncbi:MAG: hypothetical protein ABR510_10930 [Trueperaceae bacterium]